MVAQDQTYAISTVRHTLPNTLQPAGRSRRSSVWRGTSAPVRGDTAKLPAAVTRSRPLSGRQCADQPNRARAHSRGGRRC